MSFDQVETLLILFAMEGPYVSEKEMRGLLTKSGRWFKREQSRFLHLRWKLRFLSSPTHDRL